MNLRKINQFDKAKYMEMATAFYKSEAVDHMVDFHNFEIAFNELMRSDLYAECYIIEENSQTAGYILLSKTFSQEAGGICIWIEEVWIEPEFRGSGIGKTALNKVLEIYKDAVRFRLEYSSANNSIAGLYSKLGFKNLKYLQMYIDK